MANRGSNLGINLGQSKKVNKKVSSLTETRSFNSISALSLNRRSINMSFATDSMRKSLLFKGRSASQYVMEMLKDKRYYAQHPNFRIVVPYLVVILNFISYTADPVAHSYTMVSIPIVGNAINLVFTKYPPDKLLWSAKIGMWVIAICIGYFLGYCWHKYVLNRWLRINAFSDRNGSKVILSISFVFSLFGFSFVWNVFLNHTMPNPQRYLIDSYLPNSSNAFVYPIVQVVTWLGDFITAFMVTDMMLQESLYPSFAKKLRTWWNVDFNRIKVFYISLITASPIVIFFLYLPDNTSDQNYEWLPKLLYYINDEIFRLLVCDLILIMDLLIVMQDWDFPHFMNVLDLKLPGCNKSHLDLLIPRTNLYITISARYLTYGILLLVVCIDINNWYSHITYVPKLYAQYYCPNTSFIYNIMDEYTLENFEYNKTLTSYTFRKNTINPITNRTYLEDDTRLYVRYLGYDSTRVLLTGLIPLIISILILITIVMKYGRYPSPTPENPYIGRMRLIHKNIPLTQKHTSAMNSGVKLDLPSTRPSESHQVKWKLSVSSSPQSRA